MRIIVVALLASACAHTSQIGPFVQSVRIEGYDLVLERCTITLTTGAGDPDVALGACSTERRRLPVTRGIWPAPSTSQIESAISSVNREAVRSCATTHGVPGKLAIQLTIDYSGRLSAVQPASGDRELADCVGSALSSVQFPRSLVGARTAVTFE